MKHDVTHELRKPDGEWTASPVHALVKVAKSRKRATLANPSTVTLNGEEVPLDKAREMVGEAYQWPEMNAKGTSKKYLPSVFEQENAQIIGKSWNSVIHGDSPPDDQYAASLWEQYQQPALYGTINAELRTGKKAKDGPSVADLKKYVNLMFDKGGYTTTKPMTVFRALKSSRASSFEPGDDSGTENWAAKLTPGTVFTDKGIVSTTANDKFALGWLMNDAQGDDTRDTQPNDVVVEISVPTGTRIVGGDPGFIETMLRPGTTLRVKSSEVESAQAANPIDGTTRDITYTHVKAEMVQP